MNRTDQIACERPARVTLRGSAVRYGKLSQNHSPHSGRSLEWGFLRFVAWDVIGYLNAEKSAPTRAQGPTEGISTMGESQVKVSRKEGVNRGDRNQEGRKSG
jgi:hypothetical protein